MIFTWNFTASSTNSHVAGKTLKFEHVIKVVVSVVNSFDLMDCNECPCCRDD
jgi:hypothetical protein